MKCKPYPCFTSLLLVILPSQFGYIYVVLYLYTITFVAVYNSQLKLVHFKVDMELLPILVLTSFTWKNEVVTQSFKQSTTKFVISFNCSDQRVPSLLHCAALSRKSLDVTFFYNGQTNGCLWNCKFAYNLGNTITKLVRYGMNLYIYIYIIFCVRRFFF